MRDSGLSHEIRLKRLNVRARHRGTLELCFIFTNYLCMENISTIKQIKELELLMEETDQDIGVWLARGSGWPERHTKILKKLSDVLGINHERPE